MHIIKAKPSPSKAATSKERIPGWVFDTKSEFTDELKRRLIRIGIKVGILAIGGNGCAPDANDTRPVGATIREIVATARSTWLALPSNRRKSLADWKTRVERLISTGKEVVTIHSALLHVLATEAGIEDGRPSGCKPHQAALSTNASPERT